MPLTSKKRRQARKKKFIAIVIKPFVSISVWVKLFLARRPHRSFRVTRRRDYRRSLKLPSYISFTFYVSKILWQYKKTIIWLVFLYALLTAICIGVGSQATYTALTAALQTTGSQIFQGNVGQIGQAAVIFVSLAASGLTSSPTEAQQIYVVILALLVWLTTVWLLRNKLAGHKVKMRDGLYSAGAPIIATMLVTVVLLLQLIPILLATVAYSAANATGLLVGGVSAMLFWFAAALLAVMSLYWITSTFFALIIVTLPGMYPMRALKTAGDMVIGRRLRILLRILWMFGVIIVASGAVLIPVILITSGLAHLWPLIDSVPVVPFALLLMSVISFIWAASYIYLLYRRVVDDDAKPA